MSARRAAAALALVVAGAALVARWYGPASALGPRLQPRRDALEYAAAGQGIAQTGRYFLQVGPYQVRPLHAPGWPLVLAGAARMGIPASELWRLAGGFGAAISVLLALTARECVRRSDPGAEWAAIFAGLAAGGLWALAPLASYHGSTLLSDEPAVFLGIASFLTTAFATRPGMAAAGGLCFGLLAAMRPASAALLAPSLAILAVGRARAAPRPGRVLLGPAAILGAVIVPSLVWLLLWRSGYSPWAWTAFAEWNPQRFGRFGDFVDPRFALYGSQHSGASHFVAGVATLLGLGVPASIRQEPFAFGLLWPLAGWAVAAALGWRARAHRVVWAGACWLLATTAFHSCFYFLTPRYYLPVLWIPTLGVGTGLGWLLSRGSATMRRLGVAAAALLLLLTAATWRRYCQRSFDPPALTADRAVVEAWLALDDARRTAGSLPFDPLEGQALGLLAPEQLGAIRCWGRLPPTAEVNRLRSLGRIPVDR